MTIDVVLKRFSEDSFPTTYMKDGKTYCFMRVVPDFAEQDDDNDKEALKPYKGLII